MDRDTKQIIVMRTDLNMRKGKMVAQGSHASMAFLTKSVALDDYCREAYISRTIPFVAGLWLRDSFKKICVGVSSLEELQAIEKAAMEADILCHMITDSGLTEFAGVPTVTCLALGPDYSDVLDPITGHLKLL